MKLFRLLPGARVAVLAVLMAGVLTAPLEARTRLKPGFNMISLDQEVQLGREAAADMDRKLPLERNSRLNARVSEIGRQLVRYAPGPRYPYSFKVIRDKNINAFALPGGPIYVHTGVIEAAENDHQLASVLAHEIAHVALRHGTHNASKAMVAQAPLAILGGLIGSGSVMGQLAQMGLAFGANSIFLKYSRDAERQADILGTQMMYDAGYNPEEMVRFFEKLERSHRGRSLEFLSSHPNPGNRSQIVRREIAELGPRRR